MTTDRESHLKHISSRFNADLSQLKQDLLEMGGLVEQQLRQAVEALINSDVELAREVKAGDKKVDAMELAIDEEASRVIAKRQPTASDLRLVMSVVKMVADIERIGDEAKKIAKLTIVLAEETTTTWGRVEVRHIGNLVAVMLRDALDSFARFDTQVALQVMREDDTVDNEYRSATRTLVTHMMEDTRNITRCLNIMWVLRSLERVGDHAGNLAEQVIYMVEGTDVRHAPMEIAERAVEGRG
ncbi:phosphate signaling complex protein PhoU [Pseudomonas saliphila]|uniref:phosphate signaling complex protein PhoU n=1 Tax=Pseudomonas saliphila TaxID=2586906 RepID=UPI001238A9A3|nr:phosphate signaling complex protein PhoU [Pseudomonas saliphila]